MTLPTSPVATYALPSNPAVGQLNRYRHAAKTLIARDMNTSEYIEVIAWYHDEVSSLPKEDRFSHIMDKETAIEMAYIGSINKTSRI